MNLLGLVIGKPTKSEARNTAARVVDAKLEHLQKLEEKRNEMREDLSRALKQIIKDPRGYEQPR